jgi:hypothetical protein
MQDPGSSIGTRPCRTTPPILSTIWRLSKAVSHPARFILLKNPLSATWRSPCGTHSMIFFKVRINKYIYPWNIRSKCYWIHAYDHLAFGLSKVVEENEAFESSYKKVSAYNKCWYHRLHVRMVADSSRRSPSYPGLISWLIYWRWKKCE